MKIEEAKVILQSIRPGGADRNDPVFTEALKLAQENPALRDWYARQQAFDQAIADEFAAVPPPTGLRDAILARAGSGVAPAATTQRAWWHRPAPWLGLAAAVVALSTLTVAVWPEPKIHAADSVIAALAIEDAQDSRKHGGKGEEAKALNRALNKLETKLGDELPVNFESLHATGCRTVNVEGQRVLEMCFRREKGQFHVYIARRADFPRITAAEKPEVTERNGAGIATWIEGDNLYIVVSKPGRGPLDKLL